MDDLLFTVYCKRRFIHSIYPFDRSGELGLHKLDQYYRFEDRFMKMMEEQKKHPVGDSDAR